MQSLISADRAPLFKRGEAGTADRANRPMPACRGVGHIDPDGKMSIELHVTSSHYPTGLSFGFCQAYGSAVDPASGMPSVVDSTHRDNM